MSEYARRNGTMEASEELSETSEELYEALRAEFYNLYGYEVSVGPLNTGGGCMVCCIDLSINAIDQTRQILLTREAEWICGFYNYALDEEDEGICVTLNTAQMSDSPWYVAGQVVGIVARMGIKIYDGPQS